MTKQKLYIGLIIAGSNESLIWNFTLKGLKENVKESKENGCGLDPTGFAEFTPVIENNQIKSMGFKIWHYWNRLNPIHDGMSNEDEINYIEKEIYET